MEKNAVADVIHQAFEKSRGNSVYMDDGRGQLLLSTTGTAKRETKSLICYQEIESQF